MKAANCQARDCRRRTELAHILCRPCELEGRVPASQDAEEPARRESGSVCVLTLRESVALRDVLLSDSYIARFHDSGGGDLGRAFRVLTKQISWLEAARTDGGHRPRLPVVGAA